MNALKNQASLPKSILVPIDLSDTTSRVVEFARDFAESLGANLTLLHVWQPPPFAQAESLEVVVGPDRISLAEHVRKETEAKLDAILPGEPNVARRVLIGDVAESIVASIEKGRYDWLVMGTHGRSGLAHLTLGSIAEKVLRHSRAPVLTVPNRTP
jgi:nucleotide-binding universal stress UspA family protein